MRKPNSQLRKAAKEGKKLEAAKRREKCIACNGSGRYDTQGNPKCGSCNGTGLEPGK